MSKSKILISLVTIVLAVLVVGNVVALASEPTQIISANSNTTGATNNTVTQIGATNTSNNNTNVNTNTNINTNTNSSVNITSAANITRANTNTNSNTNTSNYASTNSSKLPYAGTTSSSIVILAVAFALSAIYAYKKVTDYNV